MLTNKHHPCIQNSIRWILNNSTQEYQGKFSKPEYFTPIPDFGFWDLTGMTVSETPTITESPTITMTPTATGMLADPRSEAQGTTEPAPEPLQNATYLYDGDGNLVKSVVNGRETYYLGKLYQKKIDGTVETIQKYYSSGSAQIAVRTITGESDTLQWLLSDHLGSTSTTANADGTWNSTIQYSAFGEIRASSGITATEYRYTGQLRQAELGLYYYVARWYDPAIGHFTQADTIVPNAGDSAAYDRYAYVKNNPIKYADPNGHCSFSSSTFSNPALGMFGFYASCVQDVVDTLDVIQKGERDPKTLYLEVTGIKDAVVNAKNSVDQFYNDRDTVFYSDKPILERIAPSARIGAIAVGAGAIVAGGVQAAKAVKLPRSSNYSEYGPASSYSNKLLLNKQLASQAQLSEGGNPIAGKGYNTLRDAPRLAAKYGGDSSSWMKMRSSSYGAMDGTKLETHWYRNLLSGYNVEYKTKWVTTVYTNWISYLK